MYLYFLCYSLADSHVLYRMEKFQPIAENPSSVEMTRQPSSVRKSPFWSTSYVKHFLLHDDCGPCPGPDRKRKINNDDTFTIFHTRILFVDGGFVGDFPS
jgi:hypothetical protein